jgi:hypothetical protein
MVTDILFLLCPYILGYTDPRLLEEVGDLLASSLRIKKGSCLEAGALNCLGERKLNQSNSLVEISHE